MALDLRDCRFQGPALPEPFVKFELEKELTKFKLLPKTTGPAGTALKREWEVYRRKLSELAASGGALRVRHYVIDPLLPFLGYSRIEDAGSIETREGAENAGELLVAEHGAKLRVWTASFDEDLYAPTKRGSAFRFSHLRRAQRVLLATGERAGLVTNGVELILLISDPARPESTVTVSIDPEWRRSRELPDSFRFLMALARPEGVAKLPDIVDKARLQQARVTKELRKQARRAIEFFIQGVLDHSANAEWRAREGNSETLAKELWHEGLILVYRLLFILKLESSDDPARSFSFASTSLWRNTFSPSIALAPYVRQLLDRNAETGGLLECGLRTLFQIFEQGLESTEIVVKPLGGALFGRAVMPILSERVWGERAVAELLDQLLWTTPARRSDSRERVHYGPLDVEDLGRVYEALLELEPGIATEPMSRLRRQKLEVVVPIAQGERYQPAQPILEIEDDESDDAEPDEEEATTSRRATRVEWVESIAPGRFYLRVGLGRKATGSYYTPHSFVRFLVQETLGPQVAERSPNDDPKPLEILKLKVLDPAMGSGHFLVEACRFLGEKLYEACRLCDERALHAERDAEKANPEERERLRESAEGWRQRVIDLPDPDDVLLKYLPSRSPEGEESGLSQRIALAICRRLVATHSLYGVDKNPLAVELAKLALWLESHAEGMPLTFLDHRLVVGDSVTGPFWEKLILRPGNLQEPIANLFDQDLDLKLAGALTAALRSVHLLEATVGATALDVENKLRLKESLDRALFAFHVAAAAWTGGVMLGSEESDDGAYAALLQTIAATGELPANVTSERLRRMIAIGLGAQRIPADRDALQRSLHNSGYVHALCYDLTFPEVFYPHGAPHGRRGFDAVIGNPPWDAIRRDDDQFFGSLDFRYLDGSTKAEKKAIETHLLNLPEVRASRDAYIGHLLGRDRVNDALYSVHKARVNGELAGRGTYDEYLLFGERAASLLGTGSRLGLVLPSGFHANEGATGLRRLYLEDMSLNFCFSFENRRKLFEIHSSFKFALVVVVKSNRAADEVTCSFYLQDEGWLFQTSRDPVALSYDRAFIATTGGEYLSFLELRGPLDLEVARVCFSRGVSFGYVAEQLHVVLGQEVNMTYDSELFRPFGTAPEDLRLQLHEGKTIWHFDDEWEKPRFEVPMDLIQDKPRWLRAAQFYRAAFRDVASSTNERTVAFSLLGRSLAGNTAPVEREPWGRPTSNSLLLIGLANSFIFDWIIRLRAASHVNLFILNGGVLPNFEPFSRFIVHASLRLSCNRSEFGALWDEQLGDMWREPDRTFGDWPVLPDESKRWDLRSAVDAIVADACGLTRSQYEHVLSSFSHSSYPTAPQLCLHKFDELQAMGVEQFTKRYDPYWDIPLNVDPPHPVLQLPISKSSPGQIRDAQFELIGAPATTVGRRSSRPRRIT